MDISLFSRLPDTPQKLLQLTVYVQLKPNKKKKFFLKGLLQVSRIRDLY